MGGGIGSTELIRNKRMFNEFYSRDNQNLDAILILKDESLGADRHFHHVTGIDGSYLYSGAIIFPEGEAHLVVAPLEESEAKLTEIPYTVYDTPFNSLTCAADILKKRKFQNIGVNVKALPWGAGNQLIEDGFKIHDISPELETSRRTYSSQELKDLREICHITAEIANQIPSFVNASMTELDLAAKVEYEMKKNGSQNPSFETIVAFGENSGIPHHHTSNRRLKSNEFVLVDFGGIQGHMSSDVTFTCYFGKASEDEKKWYDTVRDAQNIAIPDLKKDANGALIDQSVKNYLTKAMGESDLLVKGEMPHSTGHGLGLLTHNGGRLNSEIDFVLPDGFVTTVEPGWYIEGVAGVRLEHDVRISGDTCEILTKKVDFEDLIEV